MNQVFSRNMSGLRKKRKTIVFEEVNPFFLFIAFFFVLLRFNVFYLYQTKCFRNDTIVYLIQALGVRLINFEECQEIDISITDADSRKLTHEVMMELFKDERTLRFFGRLFSGVKDIEKKLKSVIHDMVVANFMGPSNIMCWIEDYAEPGEKIYLFSSNNTFREIILKKWRFNCVNLYPAPLFYMSTFFGIVLKVLISGARLMHSRLVNNPKRNRDSGQGYVPSVSKTPDICQHEVIYFPHESIAYGSLFLKDHFYSPDPRSPFHMSKILHVELSNSVTSEGWFERMFMTFRENKVPFCFLPDVPKQQYVKYILSYFVFILENFSYIKQIRMPKRFFMILIFLRVYVQYMKYLSILSQFKKARIALVGYDILLPETLSLALEKLNIRTIAAQERLISGFNNSYNCILDTYLTCSKISEEYMRKKEYTCVQNFKAVGFVRSDILYKYSNGSGEESYRKIKEKKRLVLAMDYHSYLDKYTNYQQQILNWRANKAFYNDLIRLSLRFPDIYVVVRSKNDDWCRVPEFRDVYEFMKVLPNLEVNRDFRLNRGYEIASMADIVIAKHTSFAHECLAAEKPVLFYDFLPNARKMISSFFDYEKYPIFVYSYEELEDRIRLFLEKGFYMDEDLFYKMKDRFFGDLYDGNVVKRVHEELMKLYSEQKRAVNLN